MLRAVPHLNVDRSTGEVVVFRSICQLMNAQCLPHSLLNCAETQCDLEQTPHHSNLTSTTITMKLGVLLIGACSAAVFSTRTGQSLPITYVPSLPQYNQSSAAESVLSLHKALVNIASVSGNEDTIAHWLKDYLESLHYHVHLQELPNPDVTSSTSITKRYNLLASQDSSLKTPILLTTHYDTVPPFTPYKRKYESGKHILYGRGSNDAKASLAAQVVALTDLVRSDKLAADKVSLLFVADEEVHGLGMRTANSLNKDGQWKAVIFGEPTESRLITGHKGLAIFELIAKGRDAHSGYPWLGESAIDMLIPVLVALRTAEVKLPSSKAVGNSTLNIGTVQGGVAGNVVAAHAKAQVAIRVGGGTIDEVRSVISTAVKEVDPRVQIQWSGNGYGPVICDTDIDGFELSSVNYGTDVPNLKGDHKRYLWGPGSILSAHSDHESIEEQELIDAVSAYQKLVLGALQSIEKGNKKDL